MGGRESVNRECVRAFSKIMERHDVTFIVVRGAAVFEAYQSESADVDVLVLAKDYERVVREVDKDPSVISMTKESGEMAGGHFMAGPSIVRFDLLNPEAFSGKRPGDDFFDYVLKHGSSLRSKVSYATVPVVWYMRLVIEEDAWLVQVQKILRDMRAGAPPDILKDVRRIARSFSLGDMMEPRLSRVTEEARRVGLIPSL